MFLNVSYSDYDYNLLFYLGDDRILTTFVTFILYIMLYRSRSSIRRTQHR